jgi:tartrate dehydratase alpha subunit/fumarate hydratase class I-like protein
MEMFKSSMLDLIVQTSTNLPPDVRAAMVSAMKAEEADSSAGSARKIRGSGILGTRPKFQGSRVLL